MENNIKEIRKQAGMQQQECANAVGVTLRAWQNYEQGTREPKFETLCAIADLFGVTTDYLLGREPAPDPFADFNLCEEDEQEVLEEYMRLPDEVRACIMDVMLQLSDAVKSRQPEELEEAEPTWTVCYSENAVSAGTGYALDEYERMEKLEVIDTPEARRADFAVRVTGDSMEPSYHDGDIVFVQQMDAIDVGEIGIFFVNGNGYLKELGDRCLISHNDAYDDISLHEFDTVRCFGKVIGVAVLP